ncbi:MAG: fluoride efflux transporter CrcB [Carbonactinosporaceae bacterium]
MGVSPAVLVAIAAGGVVGALARYGLAVLWPHRGTAFPWATFTANVVGCLLIGVLMVVITEVLVPHRLVRPFVGVGVLGGFTTYSTYAVEARRLVDEGAAGQAFTYIFTTLAAALFAVVIGMAATRLLARALRRGG